MSELEWKIVSETDTHLIQQAKTDYGRWIISQFKPGKRFHKRLFNEARIKFCPAMPEGENAMSIMAKVSELDKTQGKEWTDEKKALWKYMTDTELGFAHNIFEAKLLVDMLHKGDDGLAPAEEIISSEFEFRHEFDNWRGHFRFFGHRKKPKLGVSIATDSVDSDLDRGANGWYNIMRLGGDHLNDHERLQMIHVPYPPQVKDYQRVGAAFLMEIVERRIARGGLLREPLEA